MMNVKDTKDKAIAILITGWIINAFVLGVLLFGASIPTVSATGPGGYLVHVSGKYDNGTTWTNYGQLYHANVLRPDKIVSIYGQEFSTDYSSNYFADCYNSSANIQLIWYYNNVEVKDYFVGTNPLDNITSQFNRRARICLYSFELGDKLFRICV